MISEKFVSFYKELPVSPTGLYRRREINETLERSGIDWNDVKHVLENTAMVPKPKRGTYDLNDVADLMNDSVPEENVAAPASKSSNRVEVDGVQTISNLDVMVPTRVPEYVSWGNTSALESIIASRQFCPVYIAGPSGNGKTMMIEQTCAKLNREYVRVQINPNTDEDDLIGGWRLINGETVFAEGPVVAAMRRGAVLLIDEIDRSTNKIMCLQGILEGTPFMIKKTGQVVVPKRGFQIIATGNTLGRGSDSGKYIAASVIDDAFLERFAITLDQPFPTKSTELKIVLKHMDKFGYRDEAVAETLVEWSEKIRAMAEDDDSDIISTRRLCHIVQTFSIFQDDEKAVELGTNRFEQTDRDAFRTFYSSIRKDAAARQAAAKEEAEQKAREDARNKAAAEAEARVFGNS